MLYLVTGEKIEVGPPLTPQQVEKVIIPSLKACAKLEAEKTILAGGVVAGTRVFVAVVEAESNDGVSRILQSLPFWGLLKWDVKPLESFGARAARDSELLKTAQ